VRPSAAPDEGHGPLLAFGGYQDATQCDINRSPSPLLEHYPHAVKVAAWATILPLLTSGTVKPVVERTYKLEEAAEALRHLIDDRPFG